MVKAAGYKECKLGGMPPWFLLKAGALLPRPLTSPLFKKNVAKMVMSSMSQDIIQQGGTDSELESLTGYILKLAKAEQGEGAIQREPSTSSGRNGSASPALSPMDVHEVWAKVRQEALINLQAGLRKSAALLLEEAIHNAGGRLARRCRSRSCRTVLAVCRERYPSTVSVAGNPAPCRALRRKSMPSPFAEISLQTRYFHDTTATPFMEPAP
ncbi:MAG: hypothetical protein MZV70_72855 [Desulfobacterales bacterium]|nr:hypothetical protein [Desulfobacterales bacterium]